MTGYDLQEVGLSSFVAHLHCRNHDIQADVKAYSTPIVLAVLLGIDISSSIPHEEDNVPFTRAWIHIRWENLDLVGIGALISLSKSLTWPTVKECDHDMPSLLCSYSLIPIRELAFHVIHKQRALV